MRSYAAAADDYNEGVSELVQALGGEEDAVARQLLEDQLVIVVAGLRASCKGLVTLIFLVGRRGAAVVG